jgi:hypothetical protein
MQYACTEIMALPQFFLHYPGHSIHAMQTGIQLETPCTVQYTVYKLYYLYVICADDQTEFSEEEYRRYRDNKVLEIRKAVPSTFVDFKGRAPRKQKLGLILNYC